MNLACPEHLQVDSLNWGRSLFTKGLGSFCLKRHYFLFPVADLICFLSGPIAASVIAVTGHCANRLVFLEFALIILPINVRRVFAPLVLTMLNVSLKLVAIKSYK